MIGALKAGGISGGSKFLMVQNLIKIRANGAQFSL
jgi:hypothetical protein